MRQKILILCEYFPPAEKAGGPLRTLEAIAATLSEKYEVFVLTKGFDFRSALPLAGVKLDSWNPRGNYQVYYTDQNSMSAFLYFRICKEKQPDLIYLNSFFSPKFSFFPMITSFLITSHFLCSPRGELSAEALSIKKIRKATYLFFTKWIWKWRFMFAASSEKERIEIESSLRAQPERCVVLPEPTVSSDYQFSKIEKRVGSLKILFLARLNPIKNLSFAINCVKECPQAEMNIYGPINSFEEQKYWEKCLNLIKENNLGNRIHYFGEIANSDVASLISDHHLLFAPSSSENFGHTILESLSAGRPVLIGDRTPWSEVEKLRAGYALPLVDRRAFISALKYFRSLNPEEFDVLCKNAKEASRLLYSNEYAKSSWLKFMDQLFSNSARDVGPGS